MKDWQIDFTDMLLTAYTVYRDRDKILQDISCLALAGALAWLVSKAARELFRRKAVMTTITRHRNLYADSKSALVSSLHLDSEEADRIISLPTRELIEQLKDGVLRPEIVLQAFQTKALQADHELNCVVEPIKEADKFARDLVNDGSKSNGLLYGLPVSLKDYYGIKGYDASGGMACFLGQPYTEDCAFVKVLKHEGAVPFVRTNVPQTMISYDCHNAICGQTQHPSHKGRTPGGSTGGEGALIGFGGSVLGFGSDIGGSLRIPAMFCGICGFKPTCGRLSKIGVHPLLHGQDLLAGSVGPMARDMDTLVLGMRALLVPYMFELDPYIPALPFNNEVYEGTRRLRIGYFLDDGVTAAAPACQRAVKMTKLALEAKGHELVEWNCQDLLKEGTAEYFGRSIVADGGRSVNEYLDKDIPSPIAVKTLRAIYIVPKWIQSLIATLISPFMPMQARIIRISMGCKSITEYWKFGARLKDWKTGVTSEWQKQGFDAVISPGFCAPALPIGYPAYCISSASYTSMYNILNYPAGIVPVTKVTREDEDMMSDYPTPDMAHRWIKQGMSQDTVGLPVGVQCATLPWQDELCLRVMMEVEQSFKDAQ